MAKNSVQITKNTRKVSVRIPHKILNLIEKEENKSAALIELLTIGANKKYGFKTHQ